MRRKPGQLPRTQFLLRVGVAEDFERDVGSSDRLLCGEQLSEHDHRRQRLCCSRSCSYDHLLFG